MRQRTSSLEAVRSRFTLARASASPLARARRPPGSVTLMAIVVMVVLGIVVMTYQWIGQSTNKMLHHTYYSEKVLAIFEGLDVIARSVVQSPSCLTELLGIAEGTEKDITPDVVKAISRFGLLGDAKPGDPNDVLQQQFEKALKVTARLKGLSAMPDFASIKPAEGKDAQGKPAPLPEALKKYGTQEVMGRVAIHIALTDSIQLQTGVRDGKQQVIFTIPKRDVTMEYEFKRARVLPPFFRHFVLWIKNAISQKEDPDKYADPGNFNTTDNPLDGRNSSRGVLFVNAGDHHFFGPQTDFTGASLKGAFATRLGYIYLGGAEKAYLNLTAGDIAQDAPFSETFQLYRGVTTDFYKVWSAEFSNFVEKSQQETAGSDAPAASTKENPQSYWQRTWNFIASHVQNALNWLKGSIKRALDLDGLEQGTKNMQTSNALPLYYVVRKDYGYAVEWGDPTYQRFGFAHGSEGNSRQHIISTSLHLYGANANAGAIGLKDPAAGSDPNQCWAYPTCVLGNVYRRCLSLSGYKQRRKGDSSNMNEEDQPSSDRKFEVQAGPIEYFENYQELMDRSQDPREDKEKKPIWVWDARVRWNMDPNAPGSGEGNGTYIPISGAGLFGRLIPGLAKLWENGDKMTQAGKLFDATVAPPAETDNAARTILQMNTGQNTAILSDQNDNEPMFSAGLSPLFQVLGQSKFFQQDSHPPLDGYLFSSKVTPYFEELARCFCFTVAGLGDPGDAIKKVEKEAQDTGRSSVLTADVERAMEGALAGGKGRWLDLMHNPETQRKIHVAHMKASEIKDGKMKKYWSSEREGGAPGSAPAPDFFPWSLPDPWDNRQPLVLSARPNFRDYFEGWVSSWPVENVKTPNDFFKLYFRPLMTNPGRVLPYNYSLRFMCTDLREIFSLDANKRKDLLTNQFPAEVCDGIGYIEPGVNDKYLSPDVYGEHDDVPLNDAVLKKIYEQRKGKDPRLQSAYYFMDEYGASVNMPSQPDTKDCYAGRSFWKDSSGGGGTGGSGDSGATMTWEQATRRFLVQQPNGSETFYLNTMLGVSDSTIQLGKSGPVTIVGMGTILAPANGEIIISNDLLADKPVFLVADKITINGSAKVVEAGLIAHSKINLAGGGGEALHIHGCVIAGDWDKSSFQSSGRRMISYNSDFKRLDDFFITNIEPRIRKYTTAD